VLKLALAALVATGGQQATAVDSTYATPQVREIVERAVAGNRSPPASLSAFSARVETK
jgi:hypothetical protein